MSNKPEEIEIEVDAGSPDKSDVTIADQPIISGEEGVEELKKRLTAEQEARETERRAREAADERARAAAAEAERNRARAEEGEDREIATAAEVAKSNLSLAKKAYKDAREKGDADAELEAVEAISQAKSDLAQLEAGKSAREQAKKNPVQPAAYSDPVEARASQLSPTSAAWVRAHADWARTPREWAQVLTASNAAIAKGIPADTPQYFAEVERILEIKPAGTDTVATTTKADPTPEAPLSSASKPIAPAAAPVSRSGAAPGALRQGNVTLTPDQADVAEQSYGHLIKNGDKTPAYRAYWKALQDEKQRSSRLN